MARFVLTRIIHKLPAAEPPSLALAALPPLGLLGIVHDYACGALARKALPARTLRLFASAPYELCGLSCPEPPARPQFETPRTDRYNRPVLEPLNHDNISEAHFHVLWGSPPALPGQPPLLAGKTRILRQVDVYREPGRFGGWPANHGIWSWGHEILVGFSQGHYQKRGLRHHFNPEKPERHLLARSIDGGETWVIEDPNTRGFLIPFGDSLHGIAPPNLIQPRVQDCPGGIEFTHPDFALTLRMTSIHAGESRFHYSYDRGRTWEGPFRLPNFGAAGTAARTDYLFDGRNSCTILITVAKSDGREGRVAAARTSDGGKTWRFLSYLLAEPPAGAFSIMPSSVRLSPSRIVTTLRQREGSQHWIDAVHSNDDGRSWQFLSQAVPSTGVGNPPSLIRLGDTRLCLTYGYRAEPFGIRARLSADNGLTWGPEIALREDGGGRDLGYPRSVERPDGRVVTVYYMNVDPGGDRFIAATIWDPGSLAP